MCYVVSIVNNLHFGLFLGSAVTVSTSSKVTNCTRYLPIFTTVRHDLNFPGIEFSCLASHIDSVLVLLGRSAGKLKVERQQ